VIARLLKGTQVVELHLPMQLDGSGAQRCYCNPSIAQRQRRSPFKSLWICDNPYFRKHIRSIKPPKQSSGNRGLIIVIASEYR